jgi:hypothetical protein
MGGADPDLLIRGLGADRILGNQDENVFIASYTSFSNHDTNRVGPFDIVTDKSANVACFLRSLWDLPVWGGA